MIFGTDPSTGSARPQPRARCTRGYIPAPRWGEDQIRPWLWRPLGVRQVSGEAFQGFVPSLHARVHPMLGGTV